ncbi:MAG: hypothetical protein QM765_20940 [Myxococcales bacterium]
MDKRIVAHLSAMDAVVNLDNVDTDFGGAILDKLLTCEGTYASRLLGRNDAEAALKLPNCATWWATLNNATLCGDIVRRAIHIRLASPLEHPEERTDVAHRDLLGWVRENRPRLLACALTVARAWFVAGRPNSRDLPAFGSFEEWSAIVRGMCRWLGLADPWVDTREGLRKADRTTDLHDMLIAGLKALDPGRSGLTAGQIKQRLEAGRASEFAGDDPAAADFWAALDAADFIKDGKVDARKLGRRIGLYRDKWRKGERICAVEKDSRNGSWSWAVSGSCGSAGDSGRRSNRVPGESSFSEEDEKNTSHEETAGTTPADSRSPAVSSPPPEPPSAAVPPQSGLWADEEEAFA